MDQHGNVLDILVTSRRDTKAATRFFRKLLTALEYVPRVLITEKLGSYGVAHRRLIPSVENRRSKYLNNRAENSHQPTRQRERAMKRFHLCWARPAVLIRLQRDITTLPAWPPPTRRRGIPTRNGRPIHHLEPGHRHGHSRLTQAPQTAPNRSNHARTARQLRQVDGAVLSALQVDDRG